MPATKKAIAQAGVREVARTRWRGREGRREAKGSLAPSLVSETSAMPQGGLRPLWWAVRQRRRVSEQGKKAEPYRGSAAGLLRLRLRLRLRFGFCGVKEDKT